MTDDVVAELDRWLDENVTAIIDCTVVQRARDEIVALRRTIRLGPDLPALAREQALEEAAGLCELSAEIMQSDERRLGDAIAAVKSCAAAIRKLKGEGHG